MTFLTLAVVSLAALLALVVCYLAVGARKKASTIPGLEPSDKKLGNLGDLKAAGSLHEFLTKLHGRFGDIVSFWIRDQFCVSISTGNLFKEVQVLFDRPLIFFDFFEPMITSKGITYSNGADGRRRHRILSEAFTAKATAALLPSINKVCKEFADDWAALPPGEHVPLHKSMLTLAVTGITTIHFGTYFRNVKNVPEFTQQYMHAWNAMEAKFADDFTDKKTEADDKWKASLKEFHDVCRDLLKVHKRAREVGDYDEAPFLNALIDISTDADEEFADCCAFITGGFHTSGNLLTWVFYYLCINPDVQEKLRLEIENILKGGKVELDRENFKKLTYVRQVIDETLRCSNLAPFVARVSYDCDWFVGGHVVPKGTPVVFATGVAQEDDTIFPNPERFDPERFSSVSPGLSFNPFGVGKRRCPGYLFAVHEVYSAICTLVPLFEVKLAPQVEPSSISKKFGLITGPSSEIWVEIRKRK